MRLWYEPEKNLEQHIYNSLDAAVLKEKVKIAGPTIRNER